MVEGDLEAGDGLEGSAAEVGLGDAEAGGEAVEAAGVDAVVGERLAGPAGGDGRGEVLGSLGLAAGGEGEQELADLVDHGGAGAFGLGAVGVQETLRPGVGGEAVQEGAALGVESGGAGLDEQGVERGHWRRGGLGSLWGGEAVVEGVGALAGAQGGTVWGAEGGGYEGLDAGRLGLLVQLPQDQRP